MIICIILGLTLADVSYDDFEFGTIQELTRVISSNHELISSNLTEAIKCNMKPEIKSELETLLKKHNTFIINDIFGDNNDPNKMFNLDEHLAAAIETIDKARANLAKDAQGKTSDAEKYLAQAVFSIGCETKALKSYRERPS